MLTFKREKHVFHACALGQFYLVVVCQAGSASDEEQTRRVQFFDFYQALAIQIRDQGLQEKQLALCLTQYIAKAAEEVY